MQAQHFICRRPAQAKRRRPCRSHDTTTTTWILTEKKLLVKKLPSTTFMRPLREEYCTNLAAPQLVKGDKVNLFSAEYCDLPRHFARQEPQSVILCSHMCALAWHNMESTEIGS